jgi:hypothetical protein
MNPAEFHGRAEHPNGATLVSAAFLLGVLGLLFVATTSTSKRDTAEFAVPPSFQSHLPDEVGASGSTIPPSDLLLVAFHRPDISHFLGDGVLGLLIWMAPVAAFLIGRLHEYRWGDPRWLFLGLAATGAVIGFLPDILSALVLFLSLCWIACAVYAVRESTLNSTLATEAPNRSWMLAILCLFSLTAGICSASAHRLSASYRGLAPVMFIDQHHLLSLTSSIGRSLDAKPDGEILAQVADLPGLDTLDYPSNVFARTKWSSVMCVISGLLYLLAFAVSIAAPEIEPGVPRLYMLLWPIATYIAIGTVFGLYYYSAYVCEAARQNTLSIYARTLQGSPEEFDHLQRGFERYGWSRRLEEDLVRMRGALLDPRSGVVLQQTMARYFPSAVIAQDLPEISGEEGRSVTRPALTPVVTLSDAFYFSFVSLSTTGYGDVRPVSDETRFWAIIENTSEFLFASVLFAIVIRWNPKKAME